MVCDRCGEVFPLSNDVKYMTPFDDELDQFESNSIVKCLAGDDKGIYSIRDETVVLCPSCMAALNDWLKGEQERQAKWIYDHESNSIECDKCKAEYKLSPYERVSDFDYCPSCGSRMEEIKE
jgi:Zn finger protein HypA/HybF involved in hydrogenase expression